MLYDRLSPLLEVLLFFHIPPVDVDVVLMLRLFDDPAPAARVFRATVQYGTSLTSRGYKVLYSY